MLSTAFGVASPAAWGQATSLSFGSDIDGETLSYSPEYFVQFAPQTAADMVARLPGFEIRGSEGNERGFGQASLNILINGRRPSSKSSGANEILRRIPADNVTRIEIVDGATLDIPGLAGQVANIVAKTGEFSGSWNWAARFEEGTQPQLGDGGVNFSAKRGRLEAVGSLGFNQFTFTEDGDETFFDGNSTVIQDRNEKIGFNLDVPVANLNLTYARDNGDIANLNISGSRRNENVTAQEQFSNIASPGLSGDAITENGQDRDELEISGDYSFDAPFLGQNGRLKIIGLQRRDKFDFVSRFVFNTPETGQSFREFIQDDIANETIARAEYTWKSGETNDWSIALEGAFNTLESETSVSVDGNASGPENVRVEEDRVQANLSRSWTLSPRVNAQTSLGAEYSVIDLVTSDDGSNSFFRPKGSVSLSYNLDEDWTLRTQAERNVGQLDFSTFVSSVSFADDTVTSGGNITPVQTWEAEIELEHRNPKGLSGRAKLFYDLIEDPVVQQLFDDGSQGPENLDSNAHLYGIEGNLTWVLDDVLKGLRIELEGLLADSDIRDVVTGQNRSRGSQTLWDYDIEARWDISGTPFALEAEIEQTRQDKRFRIDEKTQDIFRRPEIEFSIIHKDLFGMQWTAKLQNIADFELRRERFIFDETRNGDLIRRELTRRQRGRRISIEVTDTF